MTDPDFDKVSPAPPIEAPRPPVVDSSGMGSQIATISWTRHLSVYVKILYKRRWLVLPVFFVVVLGTAISTYSAVSIYGANAKLLIEATPPNYGQFDRNPGLIDEQLFGYLDTQYDLLKSRSLARKTLDKLHLWDNMPPKNAPKAFSLAEFAMRPVNWAKSVAVGLLKKDEPVAPPSPDAAALAETKAQSRSIDALLRMLTVTPVKNSRIVTLTAYSFDPQLATAVVNAHAEGFLEQNAEFKFESSAEASKWLNDRLVEQRKEVDAAEQALQTYRESHSAIPPEDSQNITVQKLTQLSQAYTAARLSMLEKEVVFKQLEALGNDEAALAAFPPILSNAAIQAQKSELANFRRAENELLESGLDINHPKVKTARASVESAEAKVKAEMQNVAKAIRTDFEAAQAQERNLASALQAQKDEALGMSQDSIQFGILKREVDSTRLLFQNLLQSAKETGMTTQGDRATNVRIVDKAELPRSPVSPNRALNMQMGVLAGLLLACGLAFFLEYIDDRIKHPDEIKAYLGVPLLGLLPAVRNLAEGQHYPRLGGVGWPKLNEAFRTLRTNVIFSSADQGCRSVVITSTGPNEGKTLVAANLATSLAEAGLRVLVIDADLRRPQQHKVFEVDQEPGLSNLLVGGVKPSEVIRKTSVPGLWMLTAGRIPPNPAELLASTRFHEYFRSFSEHFDWVVIDTPPVMAVSDASVVSNIVTGVIFVVRSESVSRLAAQAAIEQLDNARANIIGTVLNRVDLDRHSYYYSQYYRKEYADYYAAAPKA